MNNQMSNQVSQQMSNPNQMSHQMMSNQMSNQMSHQMGNQMATASAHKKDHCQKHMHRYVMVQTSDGGMQDGFVEHVDDEYVYLAIPVCPGEGDDRAFFPYGGFGYGYPFFPRRRFIRRRFPLAGLFALSLLPFFI
ncbi:hypothetical protein [Paenibacillus nanensis]|nr:hypothetical protein [Paenibacillus nanensis]